MVLREYRYNLQTREITDTEAWEILDWVLNCCRRHGIAEVTLMYGYDWDVGGKSWTDQPVSVDNVHDHIRAEEEKERGYLAYDDLYIKIGDALQVYFCHHSEVHLQYDQEGLPFVKNVSAFLIEKIGLRQ